MKNELNPKGSFFVSSLAKFFILSASLKTTSETPIKKPASFQGEAPWGVADKNGTSLRG